MAELMDVIRIIQNEQARKDAKQARQQQQNLQLLSLEMTKVQRTEEIMLKEYYRKLADVESTEKLYDKWDNFSPSQISEGGADIIKFIDDQHNIEIGSLDHNIKNLNTYKADLVDGLNMLKRQAVTLKKEQGKFAGLNKTLQEHEYKKFQEYALSPIEEGGLGWATTAGSDQYFYETDSVKRSATALQMGEKVSEEHKTGATGSYGVLQKTLISEDSGNKKLLKSLGLSKKQEPLLNAVQLMLMQGDYDDFMRNVMQYPGKEGEAIRGFLKTNPLTSFTWDNLQRDYTAIKSLDQEIAGIGEEAGGEEAPFDRFISGIEGIEDSDTLFQMFDLAVRGMNPDEVDQYFNAIEVQLGVEDAGELYTQYKEGENVEVTNALNTIVSESEDIFSSAETLPAQQTWGEIGEKIVDVAQTVGYAPVGLTKGAIDVLDEFSDYETGFEKIFDPITQIEQFDPKYAAEAEKFEAWDSQNSIVDLENLSKIEEIKRIYLENPNLKNIANIKEIIAEWESEGSPNPGHWMMDMFGDEIHADTIR